MSNKTYYQPFDSAGNKYGENQPTSNSQPDTTCPTCLSFDKRFRNPLPGSNNICRNSWHTGHTTPAAGILQPNDEVGRIVRDGVQPAERDELQQELITLWLEGYNQGTKDNRGERSVEQSVVHTHAAIEQLILEAIGEDEPVKAPDGVTGEFMNWYRAKAQHRNYLRAEQRQALKQRMGE